MTNEFISFDNISRKTWQELYRKTQPLLITEELESIRSLNDNINIQDVVEIHLPLISLIQIHENVQENLSFSKSIFLKKEVSKRSFIIDISGSVAVGKPTTSHLLQLLLSRIFKDSEVEMVTTDDFIYPNDTLVEQNILDYKGFPEDYNIEFLLNFLGIIKNGMVAEIPVYSHEIYDIIPDQKRTIDTPDFLIVEGINVFQNQRNKRLYMTGYFDFSIYIGAENDNIEKWYLERFESLLELAKVDKNNYYHRFADTSQSEALVLAKNIWKTINLVNLEKHIEPTRNHAELILYKAANHKIDSIYLKK